MPRMMGVFLGLLLGLVMLLPANAVAQQHGAPMQVPDSMQTEMNSMMPMMGMMMSAMMNGMLDVLAMPESAEKLATFNRNYFDALTRKGFTREEALRIVMAVGVPITPGQR